MKRNAFTLIELLVVMAILTFIISVISPSGYRLYNSFIAFLEKKKKSDTIKEMKFNAFIMQKENKEYNISILGADYTTFQKSSNND